LPSVLGMKHARSFMHAIYLHTEAFNFFMLIV
jgi:hypothetical protein